MGAKFWKLFGQAWKMTGNVENAIEAYEISLQHDPYDDDVVKLLEMAKEGDFSFNPSDLCNKNPYNEDLEDQMSWSGNFVDDEFDNEDSDDDNISEFSDERRKRRTDQ